MENEKIKEETINEMKKRHDEERLKGMERLYEDSSKQKTKTEKIRLTIKELHLEKIRLTELSDKDSSQIEQRFFSIGKTHLEAAIFRFAASIEILGQLTKDDTNIILQNISTASSFFKRATNKKYIEKAYDILNKEFVENMTEKALEDLLKALIK